MAADFFDPGSIVETVQHLRGFRLGRFLPSFGHRTDQHIGEAITDERDRIAYLKSFRLSVAQIRRGYLLRRLAEHGWNLDGTAAALGTDAAGLARRLDRAGFGYLLRADVLDHYRATARGDRRTGRSRGRGPRPGSAAG